MSRSLNGLRALLFLFVSGPALALGLGDIRLDSALNEPLRAEILLLSATPEELEGLAVAMASTESFARYGLDRPAYLSSVRFRVVPSGRRDGNVIQLTSAEPITEPFLTFLVEATWASGRLLREYTVLLDPPTFAPPPNEPVTQTVEPPVRARPADAGEIRRPAPAPQSAPRPSVTPAPSPAPAPAATPAAAPAPEPAPAPSPALSAQPQPAPAPFDTAPAGVYDVQRGDTLWSIALRNRPDDRLSINQTMLAIYEANPGAFEDNINRLSAGASLRIPSADEIFRITRADAFAEVQRQNSAWQSDTGPSTVASSAAQPSLELVPPDEDTLSADSSTVYEGPEVPEDAASEPMSLDDIRIAEIENLLADEQDGLVVISDNEMAALRRELAELRGEELPAELTVEAEPVAEVAADDEISVDEEIFVDETEEPLGVEDEAVVDASPEPEVAEPAPVAQPVAVQPQQSLVDTILGYLTGLWGMVLAAVVLIAAAVVFFARRASGGGSEAEDATGMWATLDEETAAVAAVGDSTEQLGVMERDDETIVVEEATSATSTQEAAAGSFTETMEIPPSMRADAANTGDLDATTASNQALEDTYSSETALNLDQSDPIAEADFHMAYGLYDQAADLINGALAVEPERTDLVAKLCEIYFVWGNRDAFVDAAERFKGLLGNGEDPEWDKTVIMGQQIAGDHALFSDGAGATKAVDLAFDDDSGGAALDMDLAAGEAAGGDVIDLGAEGSGAAAAAANETNSALDFVFDDESGESTGVTEEMPAADPFEAAFTEPDPGTSGTSEVPAFDEATAEMPTVETPLEESDQTRTIEEQFTDLDSTGELAAISGDAATTVASLDEAGMPDATAEIDLDDLGLDLDTMQGDLAGLDDTSESEALDIDSLATTGRNEAVDDADASGHHHVAGDATGHHAAMDEEATEITSLLDATGQTQILPEDFAVETGTGTNIEKALAEDDATELVPVDNEQEVSSDAETMLASLDDEATAVDGFDFANTEALPEDAFDATAEVPGSTDMDLDLDDLTAALKVSTAGDTIDQPRDDVTLEQPRPGASGLPGEDSPTESLAPEDLSDDLHDARTMTEVGTKLDLARAYVDMGDPGGARSILAEVLDEGDDAQRQQAQQLLDSLPA